MDADGLVPKPVALGGVVGELVFCCPGVPKLDAPNGVSDRDGLVFCPEVLYPVTSGSIGGGISSGAEGVGNVGIPLSAGLETLLAAVGEELVVVLGAGAFGKGLVAVGAFGKGLVVATPLFAFKASLDPSSEAALVVVPAVGENNSLSIALRFADELLLAKEP